MLRMMDFGVMVLWLTSELTVEVIVETDEYYSVPYIYMNRLTVSTGN